MHQAGKAQEAETIYRQVLDIDPDHADANHLLGVLHSQAGNHAQAVELISKAIAMVPDKSMYYSNLGLALRKLGRLEEALAGYHKAITIKPDFAEAHYSLGHLLDKLERRDDALTSYRRAITIKPDYVEAHYNLGILLDILDRRDDALASYRRAITIKPDHAKAHNNLGILLDTLDRQDDALASYRRAITIKPDYAEAHNNLGKVLKELGRLEDAAASYHKALKLKPDFAEAHNNLGHVLLLRGDFQIGFEEYEWRWKVPKPSSVSRNFHQREWDGSSLMGKTILVWGEQGVGDEIMFLSLLPELLSATSHCVIECDVRLVPLFARSFPGLEIVANSMPPNSRTKSTDVDVQISMGSLGRLLRPNIQSFRPHEGYLQADADRAKQCRKRYRGSTDTLVVGISWRSGNPKVGKSRTLPLDLWDAVLTQPGIQFVNLQYGDCREELGVYRERTGVDVYQDENVVPLRDMDGFAAQVSTMDLVISIDNSTVHMAGSLGVPVWTLLPFSPEWRWLLEREDSLWYSTMRLFRQNERGAWAAVIDRVGEELLALTEGDTSRLVPKAWKRASGQTKDDVAAMSHDFGTDLDQLFP